MDNYYGAASSPRGSGTGPAVTVTPDKVGSAVDRYGANRWDSLQFSNDTAKEELNFTRSIENWWSTKELGGGMINVYSRALYGEEQPKSKYFAAEVVKNYVRVNYKNLIAPNLRRYAEKIMDAKIEDLDMVLHWAIVMMWQWVGRSPLTKNETVHTRRQLFGKNAGTVPELGYELNDWEFQFISVTPPGGKLYPPSSLDVQGLLYKFTLPEGSLAARVSNDEWVLPPGMRFKVERVPEDLGKIPIELTIISGAKREPFITRVPEVSEKVKARIQALFLKDLERMYPEKNVTWRDYEPVEKVSGWSVVKNDQVGDCEPPVVIEYDPAIINEDMLREEQERFRNEMEGMECLLNWNASRDPEIVEELKMYPNVSRLWSQGNVVPADKWFRKKEPSVTQPAKRMRLKEEPQSAFSDM